jgi:transitional endoplasmic reticulum ATPase
MRAGRLDYVLNFSIPDEKDRFEIFQVHTRERPLERDVDLTELAGLTEGMVGSQIASICRSATMKAISEFIHAPGIRPCSELIICASHFKDAIKSIKKEEEPC